MSHHESSFRPEEVRAETRQKVEQATQDAIERSNGSLDAVARIRRSMEARFLPYVEENEVIADQLQTPEYQQFADETEDFLESKTGFTACADGRLVNLAFTDPKVGSIHRRLQGMPETRASTKHKHPVLNDPDLAAAIQTKFNKMRAKGKVPQLVEYIGPHIDSVDPEGEGCGAASGKISASGQAPEIGMRFGAIKEYFMELGDGFYAFDNVAREAGGKSVTIDLVHDAFSQGLIVGLKDAFEEFDPNLSLRENLIRLHHKGKIIMSEFLDERYHQRIERKMIDRMTMGYLDVRDFRNFGRNAMLIGSIAKELTEEELKNGLDWIPTDILDSLPPSGVKNLAYHQTRNSTYRKVGNIEPSDHSLRHHPEQLIRVGPIGADFNVNTIPFIQHTPEGRLRPEDVDGVQRLFGLAMGVSRSLGIDLHREGRIITVTGMFDAADYSRSDIMEENFNRVASTVKNNAAWIRDLLAPGVNTGQAIVIGAIHEPKTRRLTHIV